ncbi:hypothetical protein LEP1GSC021_4491 [Leptospira noguchii str. 1993005606]|uniref:Uncharacterized protein n=1 Tax=Leptospira noguchii str. 2007001578 TaxID=1049974 RepID=A0ABN0J5X2_9LEPT|nr:hypothetical protein LEP1GSC035_1601 [Leptospira noguchii str. 2007001578]EPE83848.1 hypothetical protein LEP1GSC021_4491 [Leptospira noguchii str. 1993005606]
MSTIFKLVRKIVIRSSSHISGIQIPTFFRITSIFVELMLSTLYIRVVEKFHSDN